MQQVKQFQYETCCLNANGDDITEMVDGSHEVTLAAIRQHCAGFAEWCTKMGYDSRGLTIDRDWAVSYHKSVYRGKPCYYIYHSAIEYIWTE